MAITKRKTILKIISALVLSYICIFPFGQLLRLPVFLLGRSLSFNPADLIVLSFIPLYFLSGFSRPIIFKYAFDFFLVSVFSLIISFFSQPGGTVFYGLLYLVRLVSYFIFFISVWNLINLKLLTKDFLLKALVVMSFFTAVFGWIQYLFIPNVTYLKYYGWDDHLYRLVGTFLDPAFTGIIIVFGALISINYFLSSKNKAVIPLVLFFLITLAFTYSRASFISFIFGLLGSFFVRTQKFSKNYLIFILFFIFIVLFLPRVASEGTLLERTVSILSKKQNYLETLQIVRNYPVFGVGFDNLCTVRLKMFGGDPLSHSCSGADSSLLYVLATTGIVGFIVFILFLSSLLKNYTKDFYGWTFISCFTALLINSLFVQSMFYSFIMGFMAILLATSTKD